MKDFNKLCEELLDTLKYYDIDDIKSAINLIKELKIEYIKKALKSNDDGVYYYTERILKDSGFIKTHQLISAYDSNNLLPFVLEYGYDIVNEALVSLLEESEDGLEESEDGRDE